MFDWLKKMLSADGDSEPQAADPVDYEGYSIIATPRKVSGGWSTEGIIRRQLEDGARETSFIRADTCMSRDDAVQMSISKARKIIDEQGERMFRD